MLVLGHSTGELAVEDSSTDVYNELVHRKNSSENESAPPITHYMEHNHRTSFIQSGINTEFVEEVP
jgi:hypothetical protein